MAGHSTPLLRQPDDFLRQGLGPRPALCPVLGQHHVHATGTHGVANQRQFGIGVGVETVDGHHGRQPEGTGDVVDVALQIDEALLQRVEVFGGQFLHGHATVVLERAHGGHDDTGIRPQVGLAALDVEELLGAQIGPESGLGDDIIGQFQPGLGGNDGAAAVGDVGKGAAMHQRRIVFERLHEVGLDGVAQQHRHGTMHIELAGTQRHALPVHTENDVAQPHAQIRQRRGQAEDGHHLAGHHDVEAILARLSVDGPAQPHHGAAQGAVVHVHHPLPADAGGIDAQRVAVMDMVVDGRRQQVVRLGNGREVAGEVQVDVFHRHHLRMAATGCPALDAENRPHRGLAQADHRLPAQTVQCIPQTDGGRGLALARRRGADGRDQHQLRTRPGGLLCQPVQRDLGLVMTVGLDGIVGDAGLCGNGANALQGGPLGDLDVGGHGMSRWKMAGNG